ncbi:MAG: DUF4332 domain-containing protein [Candidatus Helarchaeota archaeon]
MSLFLFNIQTILLRNSSFLSALFNQNLSTKDIYKDTSGTAHDVFVAGDYAYIADGASGLAIIDISDPTAPKTPIYRDTNGYSYAVWIEGNYAFVADGSSGLAIIDISNPEYPGIPVYKPMAGDAYDVKVKGNYAYLACYLNGLAVIDISDPTNPGDPIYEGIPFGTMNSGSDTIFVEGNYAFSNYWGNGSGMVIFDVTNVSDPGPPKLIETNITAFDVKDVVVKGNNAFLATNSMGLVIINITNHFSFFHDYITYECFIPERIWSEKTRKANGLFVEGDHVFVACEGGLALIDISNVTNPSTPVYKNLPDDARNVFIDGNYAFVAMGEHGLAIIKIAGAPDPSTPIYKATTYNDSLDICVVGDYAYVAESDGLVVIDITDPLNPGVIINESLPGTSGICVDGLNVFLAGSYGLAIINISNPLNPSTPVTKGVDGVASSVSVEGDYAFLATSGGGGISDIGGLTIINVNDTNNPGPLYNYTYEDLVGDGLFVDGNFAFLTASGYYAHGMDVINVSDPKNPGPDYPGPSTGLANNDIFIAGDYAFIAFGASVVTGGLTVFDISDPTNPSSPVDYNTVCAYSVYVKGNYVFLGCEDKINIYDCSNPTSLGSPIYQELNGDANGIWVEGDYIFVAAGSSGLAVIKYREIQFFSEGNNWLNLLMYIIVAAVSIGTIGALAIVRVRRSRQRTKYIDRKLVSAIKITRGFEVTSDAFKFFIRVDNEADFAITNVEVKIFVPNNLQLDDIRSKSNTFSLGDIPPDKFGTAIYYLFCISCADAVINASIDFKDPKGNFQLKKMEPFQIRTCKYVQPRKITYHEFQEKLQTQEKKTLEVSLEEEVSKEIIERIKNRMTMSTISAGPSSIEMFGVTKDGLDIGIQSQLKEIEGVNTLVATVFSENQQVQMGVLSDIIEEIQIIKKEMQGIDLRIDIVEEGTEAKIENLEKSIKRFLSDLKVKKIPVPVNMTTEGFIRQTIKLEYICSVHGDRCFHPESNPLIVESTSWKKWVKVAIAAVKAGISIYKGELTEAAKNVWQALKKEDDVDFLTVEKQPFIGSREMDMLVEELTRSEFFERMNYCPYCANWVCLNCWNVEKQCCNTCAAKISANASTLAEPEGFASTPFQVAEKLPITTPVVTTSPKVAPVMLTDFGIIDPTALITLQKAGYLTSFDLLKVNSKAIVDATGIQQSKIVIWRIISDLLRIPTVTLEYGIILAKAGIRSVKHLSEINENELKIQVLDIISRDNLSTQISEQMLANWIAQAKNL